MSFLDCCILALVVASGVNDLRRGIISNYLTYPAIFGGLILGFSGAGVEPDAMGFGMLVAFVPFYWFFSQGWVGGGDVKLMTAVGILKGPSFALCSMFYAFFLAGLGAVLILIWHARLLETARETGRFVVQALVPGLDPEPIEPSGLKMPFGVAICLGVMVTLVLEYRSVEPFGALGL